MLSGTLFDEVKTFFKKHNFRRSNRRHRFNRPHMSKNESSWLLVVLGEICNYYFAYANASQSQSRVILKTKESVPVITAIISL